MLVSQVRQAPSKGRSVLIVRATVFFASKASKTAFLFRLRKCVGLCMETVYGSGFRVTRATVGPVQLRGLWSARLMHSLEQWRLRVGARGFTAADRRLQLHCALTHDGLKGARSGDWVIASITRQRHR